AQRTHQPMGQAGIPRASSPCRSHDGMLYGHRLVNRAARNDGRSPLFYVTEMKYPPLPGLLTSRSGLARSGAVASWSDFGPNAAGRLNAAPPARETIVPRPRTPGSPDASDNPAPAALSRS